MEKKWQIAAASLPVTEAVFAMAHTGVVGAVLGLGASATIYMVLEHLEENQGLPTSNRSPIASYIPHQQQDTGSVFYRMTHGKDTRSFQQEEGERDSEVPGKFQMDDVVEVIRDFNRRGQVYFGDSTNGAVTVHIHDVIHILDISSSGKGKSNRQRLIMPQIAKLAETYYINPLANKIKPVKDDRQYEIWSPVYDLLAAPPIKKADEIAQLLSALADEIERRNLQEENEDFSWRERTIALFVDELPEVFARCPKAPEFLDQIGRMGRQYNIIMYLCSQTAQVKNIGMSSAAQANFKTMIYGGGDQISANRVLKGQVPVEKERVLAGEKGLTLMLADGLNEPDFVRAPLVTNTGLFEYLDLPPFDLSQWVSTSHSVRTTYSIGSLSLQDEEKDTEDLSPFHFHPRKNAENGLFSLGESEKVKTVKQPVEHHESGESLIVEGENFTVSRSDETAILMAVIDLQTTDAKVTREAIKQTLGWNNKKHDIIKAVCDKHGIARR
jgi:hypothetical protein